MTRISTFQQSQTLINEMMKSQNRLADSQRQVSTGHVAEYYKDIHMDTTSLAGAKSLLSRLEQYEANNGKIMSRLAHYDQALAGMESAAGDVLSAVMSTINTASPQGLYGSIEGAFETALNFLNSRNTEGYLFSGSNGDTPPVNITSINELMAAAQPPTDIFDNNDLKASVRIDENRTLEVGVVADEIGLEIMTALQRLALWANGTVPTTVPVPAGPSGSFAVPLSQEDQSFLSGEIANLETLMDNMAGFRGANGFNQKTVEDTTEALGLQVDQAKVFISNIEDVDAAEAIANLTQREIALETSYSVLSQLNRLSLLNFL
ncbi:flagellin [uncultured Sneathiella sp.]|uniref:flagellin n=1 Tax=uncultured Sneathiella sp. TaxID=879315 RepID=UPI0030EB9BA8|tara:strand:- start:22576 stop:23535 length:960 start_codon:yes stop_codon:yes gene_type:complete